MKLQRRLLPPRPVRPLRRSLQRNTNRADVPPNAENAEYGYVLIGGHKLPVRKPDDRRVMTSVDAGSAAAAQARANAAVAGPDHEVIEDLFRDARDGKFDAFSRRLKSIIQQYSAVEDADQDASAASSNRSPSADTLAAARRRGVDCALTEWQKPENLTLQAAASYANLSDNTINTRRRNREVYALVAPNRARGFRYPQWQFDVDPERLGAALDAFSDVGQDNCWVFHSMMTRPTPELDDVRPRDFIADSSNDIQRLVQFIHRRFTIGDQGAA